MGLPGRSSNPRQKFKENKIQKKLIFEFCLSFKFASGSLHFPLLRALKITLYAVFFFLNIFMNVQEGKI